MRRLAILNNRDIVGIFNRADVKRTIHFLAAGSAHVWLRAPLVVVRSNISTINYPWRNKNRR